MAIEYDKTGKLFQVDYQSPYGGIDSTAYASAINPQNFAGMNSGYVQDNILQPISAEELGSSTSLSGHYLGYIPISYYTGLTAVIGFIITDTTVYFVNMIDGVFSISSTGQSYTPAKTGSNEYFHYIVIDSIETGQPTLYWTAQGWSEIWQITFTGTSTSAITQTTNYCGGGILGLLQNQLINIGGYSAADGATPNRFSWSAPGEYGQFQPYDIPTATGNYAAGFNDIPSISDVLTGFAAIGTVGYLFRTEGITQVNPTGNGVEPFQFNHLWASELGIGCPYPNSVSQFGSLVCFVSTSGVYSLGLAGLAQIGQSALTYLYNIISSPFDTTIDGSFYLGLQGRVIPYVTTSPDLEYILAIPTTTGNSSWQFIAINLNTGSVLNLGQPIPATNLTGNAQLVFIDKFVYANFISGLGQQGIGIILSSLPVESTQSVAVYTLAYAATQVGTFTFRKEQMKFGYVPTVTKIAVLGALIDATHDGNISFSIDGGLNYGIRTGPSGETLGFPDIVITAGVGNPGQGIIDNIYTDGVVSIQRPQLSIKLTNVQVAEAWYQGTLADFPLI